MDCKTGEIYRFVDADELEKAKERFLIREEGRKLLPLDEKLASKLEQMGARQRKGYMRNKLCVCGSGKKFKKCCWDKYA